MTSFIDTVKSGRIWVILLIRKELQCVQLRLCREGERTGAYLPRMAACEPICREYLPKAVYGPSAVALWWFGDCTPTWIRGGKRVSQS
jgi:hypothetical protein